MEGFWDRLKGLFGLWRRSCDVAGILITASLVAKSFFGRSGKSTNYVVQHDGIPSSMRIIWLFSLPLLRK